MRTGLITEARAAGADAARVGKCKCALTDRAGLELVIEAQAESAGAVADVVRAFREGWTRANAGSRQAVAS